MSRVDRAALRFDVRPGSTYAPCANRVIMYSRSAPWPVVGVKRGGPRGVRTVTDVNYPSCVCVRACTSGGEKSPASSSCYIPIEREPASLSLSLCPRVRTSHVVYALEFRSTSAEHPNSSSFLLSIRRFHPTEDTKISSKISSNFQLFISSPRNLIF